jgi:hypothetical protein
MFLIYFIDFHFINTKTIIHYCLSHSIATTTIYSAWWRRRYLYDTVAFATIKNIQSVLQSAQIWWRNLPVLSFSKHPPDLGMREQEPINGALRWAATIVPRHKNCKFISKYVLLLFLEIIQLMCIVSPKSKNMVGYRFIIVKNDAKFKGKKKENSFNRQCCLFLYPISIQHIDRR